LEEKDALEEAKYVNVKIRRELYEYLITLQGLLQIRDKKKYSIGAVIEYLLSHLPDLKIQLPPQFILEKEEEKTDKT